MICLIVRFIEPPEDGGFFIALLAQLVEALVLGTNKFQFESEREYEAPIAQLVEASSLSLDKCRFESDLEYEGR